MGTLVYDATPDPKLKLKPSLGVLMFSIGGPYEGLTLRLKQHQKQKQRYSRQHLSRPDLELPCRSPRTANNRSISRHYNSKVMLWSAKSS
ncbi:hypothetical protein J6590_059471 [Homalodisca vitripennis]|nr:hypothetical protein J6590_059471 [Homalodisca vitripennis]